MCISSFTFFGVCDGQHPAKSNYSRVRWPQQPEGCSAQRWLSPFLGPLIRQPYSAWPRQSFGQAGRSVQRWRQRVGVLRRSPAATPMTWRRIHIGQMRAIGKGPHRLENQVALDACQQMPLSFEHLGKIGVAQETAVPQKQHVLLQIAQQRVGHGDFAATNRLDPGAAKSRACRSHTTPTGALAERARCAPAPPPGDGGTTAVLLGYFE
jgi:hypothetical protein